MEQVIAMTFKRFAQKHDIEFVSCTAHETRPGRSTDWDKDALHFKITLCAGNKILWVGWYSVGLGCVLQWAKNNRRHFGLIPTFEVGQLLESGRCPTCRSKSVDAAISQIRSTAIRNHFRPDVAGILQSLALDAGDSDQPFADWATGLGYSDDSIKAKELWKACNSTRSALLGALGDDAYNELLECEE